MILGLSHIAFSCSNVDVANERLTQFGYSERFDVPALENHVAKVPFLTRHQPQHHIRALAVNGAMAIELLDHGGLAGPQTSAMVPVFCSEAPHPGWEARAFDQLPIAPDAIATLNGALGCQPKAFYDPALSMTLLWMPADDEPAGLYACVLPTDAPEVTTELLSQLRFRSNASGLWSLLTPFPALQARVIPVAFKSAEGWSAEPLLDSPGCACLALMARGTGHAMLPAALQKQTASFALPVNGKNSIITLARPDHGPIIELVEQST